MAYPVKFNGALSLNQTLTVPFRPVKAGLVKVIAVVTWHPSAPPPGPGDPTVFLLAVRLDILKPGSTVPVASTIGKKQVGSDPHKDLGRPRIVLWADTPAAATDLSGDWAANITNTGEVPASCSVTVRYQVVDGNLGKIDHIAVMMLENRSFDHMLGYLRLEKNRTDIDGLTGNETNKDDNNHDIAVHHLTDTNFRNDPEHGFDEVADQLTWPPPPTDHSNTGFVHNFAKKLVKDAQQLPPLMTSVEDHAQLAGGDTETINFRPNQPGRITMASTIDKKILHSESGNLGTVTLRRPGNSTLLHNTTAVGGDPGNRLGLTYVATVADLAVAGDWICTVVNDTETTANFQTRVTYVKELHDLSQQETADAIMGYYNGDQLPAYDMLAREFLICDRWFASLPTDTFPNRFYGLTGGSGGENTTPSADEILKKPPYPMKTIFEVLQDHTVDWKIFFSDLPFAFVFKRFAQDARYTQHMRAISNGAASDLQHAVETGDLPSVAWIDPNFSDFRESAAAASDDHPPGGITNGQRFVAQIYKSLSSSPAWTKTLLLITYDEHGGFYDHVRPPGLSADLNKPGPDGPPDDDLRFKRYGVRVPAFVVSPWVQRGSVSHATYDNTSPLNTILRRFCPDAVKSMGLRTENALDVGPLLSLAAPRGAIPPMPEIPPPSPPAAVFSRLPNSFGDVLRKAIFGF
jgi:phospholipase C